MVAKAEVRVHLSKLDGIKGVGHGYYEVISIKVEKAGDRKKVKSVTVKIGKKRPTVKRESNAQYAFYHDKGVTDLENALEVLKKKKLKRRKKH